MSKIREIEEFVKYQKYLNKSPLTISSYKNDSDIAEHNCFMELC
jgi:hypothetical protein